jgi:UDP-glucose 4-epimerase
MKVLVTGAAGYIGSHAVRHLLAQNHEVFALDNLSRGHRQALPTSVPFAQLDVRDTPAVSRLLRQERINCVMHFAAFAYVGESVLEPLRYYDNNTVGTLHLLQAVAESDVERFVFSSTCSTYGQPDQMPIREDTPQDPVNPYGQSKLFSERILRDFAALRGDFACAALRYFNVAGAASDGSIGEHHDPETHLIPSILQAALGLREGILVHGEDYPTADGTCIRDYIHVEDLVEAHACVMERLTPGFHVYNLGTGRGYSVREVIEAARLIVKRPIAVHMGPRRPGDPAVLCADASKITRDLGWAARRSDLVSILGTAWRWFSDHPRGYL